ncbi:hypothetical protein AMS59_23935, partial [Lysinibacillus sp. FJAT-14745]|uniref:AMP-binding protein n=1 Tax=Lysinibacillus sp. FJAT-14745 TaxID=1704289 RepID=UPI0006BF3528
SEQEKEKVLYTFNATEAEYPKDKTIIELFEEQVKKTPDHIAVEFNEQTLSYKQLNARANDVGQMLRELGVKPDSIVGIVTDRSLEMIIGIYGILKAGGAYLPIHPEHPIDRIKYMIEDSETTVLLAGPGSTDVTKELQDMTKIDLMECTEELENNLEHVSKSNHLAYVIYTSGTTGKPKGVMV